ncbi:MAG: hypothetical protein RL702_2179 [Pseudomonadota bacterium]|jgi:NAD(P)-dependent dehydrogenase (short-subunit alcohol dehydrogenase family)|nr:hypothetical protein [Novosphingobium sp.]HOA50270.1 hypothetical protein [Novosphingobium sp.]HPB21602.1 hypothetical protein [Novosphingobium sp.]HPZ47352.1 hypothetical protein [Novosphingobium sp.]HQE00581.1 hypothetical protein [Novosphingobium sp.]
MPSEILVTASTSLLGLAIVAVAALRGWQGWLTLKTRELESRQPELEPGAGAGAGMARIEIADLKERIRKLEAIAAGVDL